MPPDFVDVLGHSPIACLSRCYFRTFVQQLARVQVTQGFTQSLCKIRTCNLRGDAVFELRLGRISSIVVSYVHTHYEIR